MVKSEKYIVTILLNTFSKLINLMKIFKYHMVTFFEICNRWCDLYIIKQTRVTINTQFYGHDHILVAKSHMVSHTSYNLYVTNPVLSHKSYN